MHSLPSHLWPWPQPSSIVLIQQGSHCHCCPQTCQACFQSGVFASIFTYLPSLLPGELQDSLLFSFRLDLCTSGNSPECPSATKLTWIKCNFIKTSSTTSTLQPFYSSLFFSTPRLLTYIHFLSFLISSKHKLPKSKDLICLLFTLLPVPKKFIVGTQ